MDFEETYAPIKAGVRRPRGDRGGAKKKVVGLDSDDEDSTADEHGRDAHLDEGDRTITPSRPQDADGLASEVGESEDVLGSFSTPRKTKRDRSLIIATSGISPESPSRLISKSNHKANSKRLGGSDGGEDAKMDKDEDDDVEMDGILGSPSVRQSRKRAGRIGLGEADSEEDGRGAKAPKIRVSSGSIQQFDLSEQTDKRWLILDVRFHTASFQETAPRDGSRTSQDPGRKTDQTRSICPSPPVCAGSHNGRAGDDRFRQSDPERMDLREGDDRARTCKGDKTDNSVCQAVELSTGARGSYHYIGNPHHIGSSWRDAGGRRDREIQ